VLATNVAETSLTVPGTLRDRHRLARIKRYSRARNRPVLIEPISHAAARQPAGRSDASRAAWHPLYCREGF